MKNRIFILFAAIVGLNTADAQISIHPQIGGSLNKIQVFEKNEIGSIWGFQGGVGLDFKLGDVFSLEPILRYNQKGYGFENSFDWAPGVTFTEKYSLRLHYLELPVMANFNTEVGDINLVYSVGPYFGYCMAAREIIEITDGTDTEISDSKNNENFMTELVDERRFSRMDVGLNLGIRAEISNFTVGLSGAMSANNVYGKNSSNDNKHLNFQINVGYKIDLD